MKRISILLLMAAVISTTTGCVYMKDRALDFADIFSVSVGGGFPVSASVSGCGLLYVSAGFSADKRMGFSGRHFTESETFTLGVILAGAEWSDVETENANTKYDRGGFFGLNLAVSDNSSSARNTGLPWSIRYYDLEIRATCVLSIQLGLNPIELADFILGWGLVDISDDDHYQIPELVDEISSESRTERGRALIRLLRRGEAGKDALVERYPDNEEEWSYIFERWPERQYWNKHRYHPSILDIFSPWDYSLPDPKIEIVEAAKLGYSRSVEMFIEWGDDLNKKGNDMGLGLEDVTALYCAAKEGHLETVAILCEAGANVDEGGDPNSSPLCGAISGNNLEVVKLLIKKGADLNKVAARNRRALDYAISCDSDNIAITLIEAGAELDYRSGRAGRTPLTLAADKGRLSVVKALVEGGADINYGTRKGKKAIHFAPAFSSRSLDLIKYLVSKGISVNATDNEGRTPLHDLAAEVECVSTPKLLKAAKLLIDKGADVNSKAKDGTTPLHEAAGISNIRTVKLLVENGADVKAKIKNGMTPIHQAVNSHYNFYYSKQKITKLLIEKGADINARTTDGRTPLDLAEMGRYSDRDVAKFLKKLGGKRGADLKMEEEKRK